MKTDFHVHTSFSEDCDTSPEAVIQAGIQQGLSILCLTDHLDEDYPYPEMPFDLDTQAYFSKFRQLQTKQKQQPQLRIGVELGLQTHLGDFYRSFVRKHPFDFVIASIHLVDRMDPYYPEFWESYTASQGICRYLETILENLRPFMTLMCLDILTILFAMFLRSLKNLCMGIMPI